MVGFFTNSKSAAALKLFVNHWLLNRDVQREVSEVATLLFVTFWRVLLRLLMLVI